MNQREFQAGDAVVYAAEGVCTVEEIQQREFRGTSTSYYVLQPVFRNGTRLFVPTENEMLQKRLHPVLKKEQIDEMIACFPECEPHWIERENDRKEHYRQIMTAGDRERIAQMIKTLYLHRCACEEKGRRLHSCDERFFKDAERWLYDEFAYVLGIDRGDVVSMIEEKLKADE